MCEREYRRKQSRINVIPPILGRAKRRAKEKNINFDLTTSYLEKLLEKTKMICPIMKKKMIISKGQKTKYSLSIDKIDPKKGYVQGNVRFISDIANRILTNATKEEIKKVYSFFKK